MSKQRGLTAGEIALARASFVEKIPYPGITIVEGPGNSFAAHIAFAKGNPAITLGSTIYFKTGYCEDFSKPGANSKSFMHEMTHVWQYETLGIAQFVLRYAAEVAQSGFKPDDMYDYKRGETKFGEAMLEAQATMVEEYSEAVWAKKADRIALLKKNMAGSGLYGL